jgi:hypothetical protein
MLATSSGRSVVGLVGAVMSAVVLALPLVAAGGGSASAATQTQQQFEAHQIAWLAGGQYRKVYEALYPPQRAHLSYQRFAACAKEAIGLAKSLGLDWSTARLASAKVLGWRMITAPAVTGKLRALTVRTYTSLVISGHRGILPSGDSNYLARLRGIWYTIDRQLADYTKPGCGIK